LLVADFVLFIHFSFGFSCFLLALEPRSINFNTLGAADTNCLTQLSSPQSNSLKAKFWKNTSRRRSTSGRSPN